MSSSLVDLFAVGPIFVPIEVRVHQRAKRLIMRYDTCQRRILVTRPPQITSKQALQFVEEKRSWLECQIKKAPTTTGVADGQLINILGNSYTICHIGGEGPIEIDRDCLCLTGPLDQLHKNLKRWLLSHLIDFVAPLSHEKARLINKSVRSITLRDTKSRLGSCSNTADLSYSWRLVFAPKEVVTYVVCHEVAHLVEFNHSHAFWTLVTHLCPDWQQHKQWLKLHSPRLFASFIGGL